MIASFIRPPHRGKIPLKLIDLNNILLQFYRVNGIPSVRVFFFLLKKYPLTFDNSTQVFMTIYINFVA